ncbi:MAG TPA: NAD-dependent epimerase/dehydratase family protein [Vicinamibacterales bacterium]|jgi:UDP-glucose 4-epimerase|nr:NAD-dependent epimerase/dehydratase family protein [Vicinamibacterales bacterium]
MRRVFVSGAAGFIGSHLVDRLLASGLDVVGFDNLSTGLVEFLGDARTNARFHLVEADLEEEAKLAEAMAGCDFVFHLAANADVRFGRQHPRKDLDQNTIATFRVLEAMRANSIRRIAFSSTGSVYGEPDVFPTPEEAPFPVQTSLYGASKLAGEGLLSAYACGFDFQVYIFRFVSILGERYSHGHVFDFLKKLRSDSNQIEVLGDGRQRKSYLYVQDCVNAMLVAVEKAREAVNIFNLGTEEFVTVAESLTLICNRLGVDPRRSYTGGARGWVGDSPFILLDTRRIQALGWKPELTIREGIERTVAYLERNAWLLNRRS